VYVQTVDGWQVYQLDREAPAFPIDEVSRLARPARRRPHRDRRDLMERRTESVILSLACGNGASKIVINSLFTGLTPCELLVNKGAQRRFLVEILLSLDLLLASRHVAGHVRVVQPRGVDHAH
jgi:hypothetical protein